jgi:hypothetical protein
MKTYVVRVYRRSKDEKEEDAVVGSVEDVETGEQKSFGGPDELWEMIGNDKRPRNRGKNKKSLSRSSPPVREGE